MMSMDAISAFAEAMRSAGISPPDAIHGDGSLHRFWCEGDKRQAKNGWYVLHLDGIAAGAFGHWRGQASHRWCAADWRDLSPTERALIDRRNAESRARREHLQRIEHERAQMTARNRWCGAEPAQASHPYLTAKAVAAHGLRQAGDALLVPMRDEGGELWNVQTIAPDGTKRFLPGGRISGLFHRIGGPVVDRVAVAEGYATGASVAEATGIPVAVAFNCGNLEPVGRTLRKKYPAARLIYAADNDVETQARIGRNPGIEAATAAAKATGGYLAIPEAGDFNDVAQRDRSETLAAAFGGAR